MKKWIKRIVIAASILLVLLICGTVKSQIFIQDFDQTDNPRMEADEYGFVVVYEGGDIDGWVPIGDGVLLLVGLGGAYLLKKQRREK